MLYTDWQLDEMKPRPKLVAMTFFLLTFTHLMTLINPFGVLPLFLTMTDGLSRKEVVAIASKACITALICLLIIAFAGQYIFDFFGISVNGLKVVGGVIFMITGYDMLQARVSRIKDHKEEEFSALGASAAVSPLAIPMISGPGAMTAVMVATEEAPSIVEKGLLFVAIFFVLLITFLSLVASKKIIAFFGESGTKVFLRVMGLILMMIAVEFFFSGLKPYIASMMINNV